MTSPTIPKLLPGLIRDALAAGADMACHWVDLPNGRQRITLTIVGLREGPHDLAWDQVAGDRWNRVPGVSIAVVREQIARGAWR